MQITMATPPLNRMQELYFTGLIFVVCQSTAKPAKTSSSPSLLLSHPKTSFEAILQEFPAMTQPCNNNHTTTTGLPVYLHARWLSLERLKIARQETEHMLDLGIIRPSASSRSSPLHMVPKKTPGDWRPCRTIKHWIVTIPDRYKSHPTHPRFLLHYIHGSTIFS